jgi:alginate O-acetyltransferase complex protein AlgI
LYKTLLVQQGFGLPQFSDFILPLGISYFTFKHIGYLVDVQKGRLEAEKNLIAFLAFSAFFPQLVAGPISNYRDTGAQLLHLPESLEKQERIDALIYIVYGLFKKLLIADVLGRALKTGMLQVSYVGFSWAILTLVIYVMQLYFDFSGYTDFVLGVGRLFGISLPENFNNPFCADSPREFWNRWHLSMTTWFRNYVYFPVSRSMLIKFGREYTSWVEGMATLLTMVMIGLWHNFTPGFVLWGIYNATLILVQSWGAKNKLRIGNAAFARLVSQLAIFLGFSFLVFPNMAGVSSLIINFFGVNGVGQSNYDVFTLAVLFMAVFLALKGIVEARNLPLSLKTDYVFIWGVIAVLCIMFLDAEVISFAYAQF